MLQLATKNLRNLYTPSLGAFFFFCFSFMFFIVRREGVVGTI